MVKPLWHRLCHYNAGMNVILIGYRGCGKTALGKRIANALWLKFVDVDDEICKRYDNRTIAQIWDEFGEASFRETEAKVVQELCQRDRLVIALGGGSVMQPEARQAVEQASDTKRIYLACQPQVLYERIHGDAATQASRPNLTTLGGGVAEIEQVLAERDPVYRAVADSVFDVTHTDLAQAADHLLRHHL
jgi:shikimate kinase